MSLLYVIGACALVMVLLILCRLTQLDKFPRSKINDFMSKLKAGPIIHRGGQPENTRAAFRRAKSQGATGVEVDMAISKDGCPVLIHDSTVDRTSNGSGSVNQLTLEELKTLDFGVNAGEDFAGERIPSLSEALDVCEELSLLMFLEIKEPSYKTMKVIEQLFLERPQLYKRVCVISFYPNILYRLRRVDPNLATALLHRSQVLSYTPQGERRHQEIWKHILCVVADWLQTWCFNTWLWKWLGVSLVLINKNDILQGTDVDKWKKRDICVMAWTVNEVKEKEYFENVLKLPYFTDHVSNFVS